MRFYLGVSVWGDTTRIAETAARWGRVKEAAFLLTYPYLAWSEQTFYRVIGALRGVADTVHFMLDSGGFIGQPKLPRDKSTHFNPYTYSQFLQRWGEMFDLCLAWDVADLPTTIYWYKAFIRNGIKVTPVWHYGEDWDVLRYYCETTPSGWVAIGGFGGLGPVAKHIGERWWEMLAPLNAIKAEYRGVGFHALGLGFNRHAFEWFVPDSTDSTTPFSWRFKYLVVIDRGKIKRVRFERMTEEWLPPGVTLSQFRSIPKYQAYTCCWWALRIGEAVNTGALDLRAALL